jgi:predicted lipoprotein with Yx(FWY)xxD motif
VEKTKQHESTTRRNPVARIAAATMTVLTLSALMVTPDAAQAASSHSAKGVVVSVAKDSKFGTILVSGKTLYTLKSSATACGTKCLKIWPELLLPKGVTKATAGHGVNAAKLGTVTRAGGGLQVTYAGKPLYWFYKDTAPGQVNGVSTDTWGTWSVVVTKKASSGSGGTTTTSPPETTTTTKPSGGGTTTTTKPSGGGGTTTTTNPGAGTTTTTTPSGGGTGF